MNKDIELLAKQIMIECEKDNEPVTLEEAFEMAEMELKSKKECKQYVSDKTKTSTKVRERKIDTDKKELIDMLVLALNSTKISNMNISTETKISFNFRGNEYTITLTKHRKGSAKK